MVDKKGPQELEDHELDQVIGAGDKVPYPNTSDSGGDVKVSGKSKTTVEGDGPSSGSGVAKGGSKSSGGSSTSSGTVTVANNPTTRY
ncbi:hypothetical protein [Sphingorhabdus sp. Alg231-15]|uniref:hypothetical protein n=1 Tax=Sphingorhabdus sp. Alg231-15 TaxID=1922222 RepID=UPI000D557774